MSFPCPNCGAEVPHKRIACRECGSDLNTGWAEGADRSHDFVVDTPDYDELVEKEFPELPVAKQERKNRRKWIALAFILFYLLIRLVL